VIIWEVTRHQNTASRPPFHPNYPAVSPRPSPIVPGTFPRPAAVGTRDFPAGAKIQAIARPASDDHATSDTAAIMAEVIRQDSRHPAIAAAAAAAVAGRPTVADKLTGIFEWIKTRVLFRDDAEAARNLQGFTLARPEDTEVLIRPADLLQMFTPAGDCDDFTMLAAAMMRASGIPAALATIAADLRDPGTYSHVYAVAHTPAGDIAMDTSHGPGPAWYAAAAPNGKTQLWEIDGPMKNLGSTPDWAAQLLAAGTDIAKMQATPEGYYRGSDGTVYRLPEQPTNANPFLYAGSAQAGSGSGTLLLIVIVAAVFLYMMNRRNA